MKVREHEKRGEYIFKGYIILTLIIQWEVLIVVNF